MLKVEGAFRDYLVTELFIFSGPQTHLRLMKMHIFSPRGKQIIPRLMYAESHTYNFRDTSKLTQRSLPETGILNFQMDK